MMRMSGSVINFCLALFFTLASVSAVKKLNSINDLKKIYFGQFGQSVPKHSLLLLHWFANVVEIDSNGVVHLAFDPNDDYGSHYYGNFEDLLPYGYKYYTVGNLYQDSRVGLPSYVTDPIREEYRGSNMGRIIIGISELNRGSQGLQWINTVYLTQHYGTYENQGTGYDPDRTYQVTTNLLREIRQFSVGNCQYSELLSELRDRFGSNANDHQLEDIRNTWGHLACLGLLLFIVIQEGCFSNPFHFIMQSGARRNDDTNLSTDFSAHRQTYENTDISDSAFCVILFIIAFVIFWVLFLPLGARR